MSYRRRHQHHHPIQYFVEIEKREVSIENREPNIKFAKFHISSYNCL